MVLVKEKGSIVIFTLIAVIAVSAVGVIYYLTTTSKSPVISKEFPKNMVSVQISPTINQKPNDPSKSSGFQPGPILNDALLPPGSVRDVQLVINFGQGKKYEALQDVIKDDEKTPLGLLKGNKFGIKREMNFDKYYADELIEIDSNNLQSIGDYKNDSSHKWTSYVNSKVVSNPSSYPLKDKNLVEWIYEVK